MNYLIILFSILLPLGCSNLGKICPKEECGTSLMCEIDSQTCQIQCAKDYDCGQGLACDQSANVCFSPVIRKKVLQKKEEEKQAQIEIERKAKQVKRKIEWKNKQAKRKAEWKALNIIPVEIPGGSFMMGSNDFKSTKPEHSVQVGEFYLSKTEITVKQYRACVKAGVCSEPDTYRHCNWNKPDREDHPINCVSWYQARKFSLWVGGDLPTEAQWEYAARSAGKDRKYPWGNEKATCDHTVMKDGKNDTHYGCGKNRTWAVCSKVKGNTDQGLCDMSGNTWEWVRDAWQDDYQNASTNGSNICTTSKCKQSHSGVARGGSWYFGVEWYQRVTSRYQTSYSNRAGHLGFRVLLSSPDVGT